MTLLRQFRPDDVVAYETTSLLGGGATYDSGILNLENYTHVQTNLTADQDGTIIITWYADAGGTDVTRTLSIPYETALGYQVFAAPARFGNYVRYQYTNGATPQGDFYYSTTFMGHAISPQLLTVEAPVSPKMVSQVTRAVLMGKTDGNKYINVPVTTEGHIEVAIHAPRLPFGSVHTENLTPIFQSDAVYGLNDLLVTSGASLSGVADTNNSSFRVQSGTTAFAQAQIQSRQRLRYRPGQGTVGRFTAKFTTGVANSYQVVGLGHAEDGVYFAYKDTDFGILYTHHGTREVQTLTITTGSSTAENVTVQLDGVNNSVAVTNSGSIQRTVWELSQGSYTGWKAYPQDDTVVFVANAVGDKVGAFGLTATTAIGAFVETLTGAASTEVFVAQSDWNDDPLDGTGLSGATLDPTKGNVYQINIQYLGYGPIVFMVEIIGDESSPVFVAAHTLRYNNTETQTSFGNPSFPFTMATYSAGSTTNLTLETGSFAGFIEGQKVLSGPRFSYAGALETTVTAASKFALFTLLNPLEFGGRANQTVINVLDISVSSDHTQPVNFFLIKNGELTGDPDFSNYATGSVSEFDNSSDLVTFTDNNQIVWAQSAPETGGTVFQFDDVIELQPGEWLTVAAQTVKNTASFVSAILNTREDQ
jgi:hypothetical protein